MDKNIVILEGLIGEDFKYGKAVTGKEYATFSLSINTTSREYADSTERTHSQTYVRIFVYDKRIVEYLRKVGARRGQRASIYGRISSHRNEYKGVVLITNNVVCRDVRIIKMKDDSLNINEDKD